MSDDKFPAPEEAIKFLSQKEIVETERWDDLKWGEHSHAFTVAHSRNAGVLDELFGLLNRALENGESFQSFKKELRILMEEKGWYGRQDKGKDDKKYINWRTRLIYDVNMRTAYSAGQYRQQLRGASLRPIWVYKSKLAGKNRREDHKAMHNKAFRYDDPFWNTFRPPNGWGCECYVVSMSEEEARQRGFEVLATGPGGNLPAIADAQGNPVDWNKFAPPEWQYNPGLEAFAPDFKSYENLAGYRMSDGRTALDHVIENYHTGMNMTRMTEGEFVTLLKNTGDDEIAKYILYQTGNLDQESFQALQKAGIQDSKIMATVESLYNGNIPGELFSLLYRTLQTPGKIYENTEPSSPGSREFSFIYDAKDGRMIEIVLVCKKNTALRVVGVGVTDRYPGGNYKEIK
ncbi:MAG: hypothetical protein JXB88_26135 [Spirochaetales bacterium]|nr:hypothetical protein [Spirochaetales bacterium]